LTILAAIAVLLLSLVGASVLGIAAYDSGRISVEGRAEVAQAEVFNKIVYYDVDDNIWKNFNTTGTEDVVSMGIDSNGYMIYATATKVKRISLSTNVESDVTNSYVAAGGVTGNIVDITSADRYTYILEKDAKIMWTGNSGETWNKVNAPTNPVINDAKYIGSDGSTITAMVAFGNNKIIFNDINRNWLSVESPDFNFSVYGNITSVEYSFGHRIVSTDKGYIMQAPQGKSTDYRALPDYHSRGQYIFGNIYHNSAGYYFGSAFNKDKTSVGFMQYDGFNNVYLRAVIPGCSVGKSVVYRMHNEFSYAATIKDVCDPNVPPPPTPPAAGGGPGVSVHTKVAGPDGTATVKSGDTATFTLTVTNPSGKPAKVEFTLPTGFTFRKMVGGSLGVGNPTQSAGKLTWTNVPARNGTIVFETKAP